jgi:protease I
VDLKNVRAAVLAENQYQELELWCPALRLREEGADVYIVGTQPGAVYGSKNGYPVAPDVAIDVLDPADFDVVVVPGGYSPDFMRTNDKLVQFVKQAHEAGAIVAAICHAGWVLASAGIAAGRRLTCVRPVRDDVINAGGTYVDQAVVRDGNLITSRLPNDIADFNREIVKALRERPEPVRTGGSLPLVERRASVSYESGVAIRTRIVGRANANYAVFATTR